MGNFVINLLLRPSRLVQLMAINTLTRNARGATVNASTVERWATISDYKKPHKAPEKNKIVYRRRVFTLIEEEAKGA